MKDKFIVRIHFIVARDSKVGSFHSTDVYRWVDGDLGH